MAPAEPPPAAPLAESSFAESAAPPAESPVDGPSFAEMRPPFEPPPPVEPSSTVEPPPPSSPIEPRFPEPPPTTLIIERQGRPEGVAVGRGELTSMEVGTVRPVRGERPALRLNAGTGAVLVSFDSVADRDRAAAELTAETDIRRTAT
jgi:hypothetical protein